ncbi:MAG: ferrous iron transport protein A [Lachnospiraceae bacterium]|jgi:ferrous iron transport protein A|nr:ferrous iron transport protein A [Lachnospiraceae bacterium]
MKLNEGKIGQTYLVKSVSADKAVTRRLEALGVNEMTPVTVLNKKGSGSVIFKVRGTRLAVGRQISDGILVEELDFSEMRKAGQKHGGDESGRC